MSYKTNDLGMPIEYKVLPQFFDAHNIGEDTNTKNSVIEGLLKQHGVHTVYDMTCGTGSQIFYLQERGYHVEGSDLCPELVEQAKEKAKKLNLNVSLDIADIRTAQKGQFDAVISIFSAIGHLSRSDFEIALQNIRKNIKDGGIYVFDIFNLQALTDEVVKDFVMDVRHEIDGVKFRNRQTSDIDRENGLLVSHDHYTICNGGVDEEHKNTFSLQIYTYKEMKELLRRGGFEVVGEYDMDGSTFIPEVSLSMLMVARKAS